MIFQRLIRFFTSLKLTVVLLAFAIVLVFVGTVAQADEGLYAAQTRYFKHWLVVGVTMFGKRVPLVLPGGYLLGTLLLVNLLAAHVQRFQFTRKKIGITVAHSGVILLLVGQLTTDLFSHETQIRFAEGETRRFSESALEYELAFRTSLDQRNDQEIVIPARWLKPGEIRNPQLPLVIRVKSFWKNSEPSFRAPMMQGTPPITTNGIAHDFDFRQTPDVKSMDDKNVSTALIEIVGPTGSLGDWVVSGWASEPVLKEHLGRFYAERMKNAELGQRIVNLISRPQAVEVGGKRYVFELRPRRVYNPFSLTLLQATHSVYRGTDIPKDFRSRVRLENPQNGENREVEIFMNSPLRYAGLTFYQYQMEAGEAAQQANRIPTSTLQVVRNPSWLTPYVGCALVGAGLLIQFLTHLAGFISRKRTA